MTTANEYREQLAALKTNVSTGVAEFVRGGYVTREQGNQFLAAVGLEVPEDEETRAARQELESFQANVRLAVEQAGLSAAYQGEALRRFGINA